MRAEIRTGGDGVGCWNAEAVQAYVAATNAREAELAERNPDLVVTPGRVSCYGCEVQEYGYGVKCTARLIKTVYAIPGEVPPSTADAAGWHREIPGLQTIRPDPDGGPGPEQPSPPASAAPVAAGPAEPAPTRSGLRGLFGRHG